MSTVSFAFEFQFQCSIFRVQFPFQTPQPKGSHSQRLRLIIFSSCNPQNTAITPKQNLHTVSSRVGLQFLQCLFYSGAIFKLLETIAKFRNVVFITWTLDNLLEKIEYIDNVVFRCASISQTHIGKPLRFLRLMDNLGIHQDYCVRLQQQCQ